MPVRTILIGIIFIVVSGFIAYFGDWLGRYLGKRRISVWGLRPRHTAMLITSFTGSLIAFLTIVAVLATAQTFREIIVRGERILEQSRQLQARYAQLSTEYSALQQRYEQAAERVQEQQRQMAENTRQLRQQQQLLEAVRQQLAQRQQQVAELNRHIAQQSQQLASLQAQNARLQSNNRQLSQTNAQLQRQGQFLREQNLLYQQNNADLASQNMQYARENIRLNDENARLQQQATQLRQQTEQLSQQSRQLQQQADALRATIEQLQAQEAELRELVEQLEQLKEKPIVARRGEEIARRVIPNGLSLRATRNEIYRLLVEAGRIAQERGAAAGTAHRAAYIPLKRISTGRNVEVLADEAVSVEALAEQIARSDTPVVVLAVAVRNSVAGEPVQVDLKPFRNRLVYRKDEEIARARIWSGRGTGEIANTLIEFLRDEVRQRAIEAGIIPRIGADGEPVVGTVPNEQITDLAERIAREGRGRYVSVAVLAEADTYSADSLRLRFRLVP